MFDQAFHQSLRRVTLWPLGGVLFAGAILIALIEFILLSAERVEHTDQVIAQAHAVGAKLVDMETGLRGFLVTREPVFLEPYEGANNGLESELKALSALVADNAPQTEAVRGLRAQVDQWRAFAEETLRRRREGAGFDEPDFNARGKALMDSLRTRLSEIDDAEQQLRLSRTHALGWVRRGLFGSVFLALVVLGPALTIILRRFLRRTTRTYQESTAEAQRQTEQFRVSLRSIGDAVIATDASGRVTFLNPVAEQLTGWRTSEAAGKSLEEVFVIFNEQTGKPAENPVGRVLREQKVVGLANHTVLRARDGREIPIDDSAAPIRGDAEEVQGVILVFHDVTEARAAQRQIRESRERLQAALTGSGAGTFRWDIQTNALDGDENLDALFGLPAGETIRSLENFIATVHPDDRAGVIEACERCAGERADFDLEFRVLWPDESVHWLHDRGKMFCDDEDKPLYMTGACVEITARKQTEAAFAEARVRLDATLDSSEIGTWVWDVEHNRVSADANLARLFCVTAADAAGGPIENYIKAIHPDDHAHVESGIAESLRSERGEYEIDYRLMQPDGTARWVVARGKAERNAEGKVVRFPGVVIDITARKAAESAQRESEDFLRLVLDSAADGFYSVDHEGVTTLCNAAFRRMLGFERAEDAIGRTLHGVIHHSHPDGTPYPKEECPLYRTARTGEPAHRADELFFRLDGSSFPVEYWSYPIMRDGRVQGAVITFIDITERKEAEEALRESAARLQFTLESAHIGDWDLDLVTDRARRSLRHDQAFGYDEPIAEWGFQEFLAHVHPDDRAEVSHKFSTAVAEFKGWHFECRVIWPGGSVHWIEAHGNIYRTIDGKPRNMLGIVNDITARKQAEEELRQAKEQAERASRSKDEFLAALSHELRTPLTPVLMTAAALRDETRLPLDVREQLGMMQRNIELEARLIDDLLDLTRISRGKLQLRSQSVDAHSLVALSIEMVRSEALRKRQTLEVDLAAQHSRLTGDPARLQQVFWNLLKNAVKFTPEAGRLIVRSRDANGRLTLEISDTGIGIEASAIERIFLPFEQAAALTSDHRFGGLGLGLAISKAIVDLHGGNIHAQSGGIGQGAVFRVELPVGEDLLLENISTNGDEVSGEVRRRGEPLPPLRLLLVEDHEPTLAVLERLLTRAGHCVTTAMSVAGALQTAAGPVTFDALVSDVGLPDGTGFDLMEKLRINYGIRGIALSGYGMDEDLRRSREAGFSAHLTKPIDFAQLEQALAELMADDAEL